MKKEFLMGNTGTNLIFAIVDIRKNIFTVSFKEVSPIEATEEYLYEQVENLLEDIDVECKLDMLERFDCKYSELSKEYLQLYGVGEILDISLYPESYDIEGYDTIYFESSACGQVDTREELIPINSDFSNYLHDMWDNYHLKEIKEEIIEELILKIEKYEKSFNEINWIESFLETIYK